MINCGEYKSAGTYLIALHVDCNNGSASYLGTYFDRFEGKCNPKEIKENKNVTINIYRIPAYDSSPNKNEKKKDKM